MSRYTTFTLTLLASTAAATQAFAQTVPAEAQAPASKGAEETGAGGLEEIIVTAQKKSENLQDVALAVSAFNDKLLETSKLNNVADIAPLTPSLQYSKTDPGQVQIFVRGVGSTLTSSGSDNSVGAFLDDVYIARGSGFSGALFDLERVEVVRGPAGALYGKNTIGGAVNFITKRPTFDPEAGIRIDVGNYDLISLAAHASGPFSDKLAARIAVSSENRDGFNLNTFTGNRIEDENSRNVRGQLLYRDGDFDALLIADYGRNTTTGNWRWQSPVSPRNQPFANPNPRSARHVNDGKLGLTSGGVSLRMDWDTAFAKITSITAWRRNTYRSDQEVAGNFVSLTNPPRPDLATPNPDLLFFNDISERSRQFSQEIRASSTAFDDQLEWIAGAYYLREHTHRDDGANYIFPGLGNFVGGETSDQTNKTDSFSVFGEATYHPSSDWDITAGLRWSKDSKHFTVTRAGTLGGRPPVNPGFTVSAKDSWSALTPRLSVSYKPSQNQTYYAAILRGFKSGAFDGSRDVTPQAASRSVGPETAWNYEVGAKTQWFDNRLRVNLAAFYTDYRDLQTQQLLLIDPNFPPQRVLVNAGKVTVKGIELEAVAALFGPLRLEMGYGYLDSKFASTLIVNNQDLKGFTTRRAPKHKGHIALVVDQKMDVGTFRARATYQYTSSYFIDNNENPVTRIAGNGLLSGNIDFTPADSNWTVSLWGKNLTNELYFTNATAVFNTGYVLLGAPRTYGVSISWKN